MTTTPPTSAIAQAAYRAVRVFALAQGDYSKPDWPHLDDAARERVIAGVEAISQQPYRTASENHAAWMLAMERDGWSYGPAHRKDLKQHPAMMPYGRLSTDYRRRNEIFLAVVKALMGHEVTL